MLRHPRLRWRQILRGETWLVSTQWPPIAICDLVGQRTWISVSLTSERSGSSFRIGLSWVALSRVGLFSNQRSSAGNESLTMRLPTHPWSSAWKILLWDEESGPTNMCDHNHHQSSNLKFLKAGPRSDGRDRPSDGWFWKAQREI